MRYAPVDGGWKREARTNRIEDGGRAGCEGQGEARVAGPHAHGSGPGHRQGSDPAAVRIRRDVGPRRRPRPRDGPRVPAARRLGLCRRALDEQPALGPRQEDGGGRRPPEARDGGHRNRARHPGGRPDRVPQDGPLPRASRPQLRGQGAQRAAAPRAAVLPRRRGATWPPPRAASGSCPRPGTAPGRTWSRALSRR